jgi:fatty-acid desaturase
MPASDPSVIAPWIDRRNRRLDWPVILAIGGLHLGCLAAPFTFSWTGLALVPILLWVGTGLGVTLCYHRLLTHRSYRTPKAVEYALTVLATLDWQGGPIRWVGTHRLHHRDSDRPGDPHSPRHGFTWAHMLWCMYHDSAEFNPYDAARDLQRDPGMVWLDRWFFLPQLVLAAGLYAGGWALGGHMLAVSWVVWGICVRTVVAYHTAWLTNSAAHTWGYRNFQTTDNSRNTWWRAPFSFGEGWHNNHHAQQRSAAHGMRWFEIDPTYWTICLMGRLGLATRIVRPERPKSRARLPIPFFWLVARAGRE